MWLSTQHSLGGTSAIYAQKSNDGIELWQLIWKDIGGSNPSTCVWTFASYKKLFLCLFHKRRKLKGYGIGRYLPDPCWLGANSKTYSTPCRPIFPFIVLLNPVGQHEGHKKNVSSTKNMLKFPYVEFWCLLRCARWNLRPQKGFVWPLSRVLQACRDGLNDTSS